MARWPCSRALHQYCGLLLSECLSPDSLIAHTTPHLSSPREAVRERDFRRLCMKAANLSSGVRPFTAT